MKLLILAMPLLLAMTAQSSTDDRLTAGYWVTTTVVNQIDFPQLPDELVEAIRAEMGTQVEVEYQCISEAEAADPGILLAGTEELDKQCSFDETVVGDGLFHQRAVCADPDQGSIEMTIDGSYDTLTMRGGIAYNGAGSDETGPLIMSGAVNAQYVGDCPAENAATN